MQGIDILSVVCVAFFVVLGGVTQNVVRLTVVAPNTLLLVLNFISSSLTLCRSKNRTTTSNFKC
jgi:hypothetical protein